MSSQEESSHEQKDAPETAPEPMNRAERRAAAKGKKADAPKGFGGAQSSAPRFGRPGGTPGQTRLPRTGHKGA